MVEGPMNIEPKPVEVEVETTFVPAEAVEKQQTGLTDVPPEAQPASVHFPTHQPQLSTTAQATLNALKARSR